MYCHASVIGICICCVSQVGLLLIGEKYKRDRSLMFVLIPLDDHEVVNSSNTMEFQAVTPESYR